MGYQIYGEDGVIHDGTQHTELEQIGKAVANAGEESDTPTAKHQTHVRERTNDSRFIFLKL
jgi:hypothetical protein